MAPRHKVNGAAEAVEAGNSPRQSSENAKSEPSNHQQETATSKKNTKKRKKTQKEPAEGSRKSVRQAPKAQPSQEQLLRYMLSDDAVALCRPDDETRDLEKREEGKKTVTYTSGILNPFQELVCAVILSRPISHMLGLRTVRTIFNSPYNFTSAQKIQDAGLEKVHQALWDARTQHKAKTADQISALADLALDYFTTKGDDKGKELGEILSRSDVDEALQYVIRQTKGFGPTGSNIFRRRIQWQWEAAYPFVDSRSANALRDLGLPEDSEELKDLIEQHWDKFESSDIAGRDAQQKKRRALVLVLERATGAMLEGKMDRLREAAVLEQ